MSNCVFCKIISGEFSSYKVYEDDFTIAFMDIAKDVDYHILVIPKKHITNILDCDEETLCLMMNTVKKISNYLVNECGFTGVNILNASGISAGQSVQHFHIHLIARTIGDGVDAWPQLPGAKLSLEQALDKIKM
jgi:histidine triad (HIT) family protein